ncbi:spermidine synthase [Candidatus Margulisiibacteriota bacterium]
MPNPLKKYDLGIFLLSVFTLYTELTLFRFFSSTLHASYATIIICLAMAGLGIGGALYLFLRKINLISSYKLFYSVITTSVLVILMPVSIWLLFLPGSKTSFIAFYPGFPLYSTLVFGFLSLIIFSLAGYLFTMFLEESKKKGFTYGLSFLGGTVGCLGFWFVFSFTTDIVALIFSSILILFLGFLYFKDFIESQKGILLFMLLINLSLMMMVLFTNLKHHSFFRATGTKRITSFIADQNMNRITNIAYSPISVVHVASTPTHKNIYFHYGKNISFAFPYSFKDPTRSFNFQVEKFLTSKPIFFPLNFQQKEILVIGAAGGREVLASLLMNKAQITAVELDPGVIKLMEGPLSDYSGNIYQHPRVNLICEEGRSYLTNSNKKFDLIMQIQNNTHSTLSLTGIDFASVHLVNLDAFKEYWKHLSPNGIIEINRPGIFMILPVAWEALKQLGISDPRKNILVFQNSPSNPKERVLLIKKSAWQLPEISFLQSKLSLRNLKILFGPQQDEFQLLESLENISGSKVNLEGIPFYLPTDNKPFFEKNIYTWIKRSSTTFSEKQYLVLDTLARSLKAASLQKPVIKNIFFIGIFLAIACLIVFQRFMITTIKGKQTYNLQLYYFAFIALAYLLIELALIQKLTLWLGHPVYSTTFIIMVLLLSSGLGSIYSDKLHSSKSTLGFYFFLIVLPLVFYFNINSFGLMVSKLPYIWRFISFSTLIFPLGFVMGTAFPLGLAKLCQNSKQLVAVGYGLNGLFSALVYPLSQISAMSFGYSFHFMVGSIFYLLASTIYFLQKHDVKKQ